MGVKQVSNGNPGPVVAMIVIFIILKKKRLRKRTLVFPAQRERFLVVM